MSLQDEITKAVGAHGVWKMRLRTAIDTGKADANAADVAKDNACAFGQWLYGPAIPALPAPAPIISPCASCTRFHQCAAKVIEGHRDAASCRHGHKPMQAHAVDGGRLPQVIRRPDFGDDEVEGRRALGRRLPSSVPTKATCIHRISGEYADA